MKRTQNATDNQQNNSTYCDKIINQILNCNKLSVGNCSDGDSCNDNHAFAENNTFNYWYQHPFSSYAVGGGGGDIDHHNNSSSSTLTTGSIECLFNLKLFSKISIEDDMSGGSVIGNLTDNYFISASAATSVTTFSTNFFTDGELEAHLEQSQYEWSFLFVIFFIVAGGLGNILVCLAICLDKKLQNVTNYFLLSLAFADLLVSLFVMPLGAIPGFLGK